MCGLIFNEVLPLLNSGKIVDDIQKISTVSLLNNDELTWDTIKKCMNSWLKRQISSSAVTMGTENE